MAERMHSESCPFCGSTRAPLPWSIDTIDAIERGYKCRDCRRSWSVTGAQLDMFADPDEAPALRLEV